MKTISIISHLNLHRAICFILVGLLSSCASVSVRDETAENKYQPQSMPKRIYLVGFEADEGEFNVDREGDELVTFREEFRENFLQALEERLEKHLAPTKRVTSISKVPRGNYWILDGRFVRVNQGSRALRAAIGFGAGGTKMETEVSVYYSKRSKKRSFYSFETTGGSNAEPGLISAAGPGGGALAIAMISASAVATTSGGIAHGLTEDRERTARMITATLSDYCYQKGWIDSSKRLIPKRIQ
ncbi:MAG: DUF4410 domain-containing protein [Verrucomicrobiota bacterium]